MGMPAMYGDPASSDAQQDSKTFPADSSPSDVSMVSGMPDATPTMVGSPVQPEMRQVTPIDQMGEGYTTATGTDPS